MDMEKVVFFIGVFVAGVASRRRMAILQIFIFITVFITFKTNTKFETKIKCETNKALPHAVALQFCLQRSAIFTKNYILKVAQVHFPRKSRALLGIKGEIKTAYSKQDDVNDLIRFIKLLDAIAMMIMHLMIIINVHACVCQNGINWCMVFVHVCNNNDYDDDDDDDFDTGLIVLKTNK
uniref:Uncharacterized protein n=1 Tax=Glossina austeni TaxID=7395 RepID=A0A1A9VRW0_GLOAU